MELPQIVSSAPVDPSPVKQNDDEWREEGIYKTFKSWEGGA